MPDKFGVGAPLPFSGSLLASAARTATTDSGDVGNVGGCGVIVVIDVTAVSATPSVVFKIQGKDKVSGKYYDLLESAAVTAVGTTVLMVHPALTVAANTKASALLPDIWRLLATAGDADSITYSVSGTLVP